MGWPRRRWASIGLARTVERAVPGTQEVLIHAEALASLLQWSVRLAWLCLGGIARQSFFNSTAAFARCKVVGADCLPCASSAVIVHSREMRSSMRALRHLGATVIVIVESTCP